MISVRHTVMLAATLAVTIVSGTAVAQQQSYRVNDQQVQDVLNLIDARTGTFRLSFDRAIDRSRIKGSRMADDIGRSVVDFKQATSRLRDRVNDRRSDAVAVDDVLKPAAIIDTFMAGNQLDAPVQRDWQDLRRELEELAQLYGVTWNRTGARSNPPPAAAGSKAGVLLNRRLGGTYQLDSSRGDDPRRAAEQATSTVPPGQRDRAYQRLMNRLEAPDVIAIDRQGNQVSMATSRGPRVTFDADNRIRTEAASDGKRLTTRAAFTGDQLVLTTTGGRANDFTVTFEPMDAGANLRVTRRIVEDGRRQPVTVASFYRKSSDQPQWNVYPSGGETGSDTRPAGDFIVPVGTRLVATLDEALSTKTTRDRDRFSLTVSTPSQYSGAIIEGFVSNVNASGRVSGRADMALNFQTIGQRNGRSSQFAGVIESMRTPDGETVRVDNEGKVEPTDSQTEKTVQRGTVGAALGAIIGAIAGGGKGAAVGAVIGAGGGAGTVIAAGRDQLDLQRGTEVTITSGAAARGTAVGGAR
jgi:hypothetical protein